MKKIISLISIMALMTVGLSACIQIVTSTPEGQTVATTETTAAQAPSGNAAPAAVQQTVPPVQQQIPAQGGYSLPQFSITVEQAKDVAVKAVGLTEGQVTFIKQKQDYDDGMPEYEIEFVANNMKYEFDISGVNGAILKQEMKSIIK